MVRGSAVFNSVVYTNIGKLGKYEQRRLGKIYIHSLSFFIKKKPKLIRFEIWVCFLHECRGILLFSVDVNDVRIVFLETFCAQTLTNICNSTAVILGKKLTSWTTIITVIKRDTHPLSDWFISLTWLEFLHNCSDAGNKHL